LLLVKCIAKISQEASLNYVKNTLFDQSVSLRN